MVMQYTGHLILVTVMFSAAETSSDRSVVKPAGTVDLLAVTAEQGVVNRDRDRRARCQQADHVVPLLEAVDDPRRAFHG
jgi:hypothetical protein